MTEGFQQQMHDTILEVDLMAMRHNLDFFRNKLAPGVKMMAMVKAFGYGSGGIEVAKMLENNNVDYLGVAFVNEGVELRNEGIRTPIMVMNPGAESYEAMLRHNLEPEIFSIQTLKHFIQFSSDRLEIKVHLKVETGMHRLGFHDGDISEVLMLLSKAPNVKVASVFSHLAASDDRQHDAFTKEQIVLFEACCDRIQEGIGYDFIKHIVNSAGISRFPEAQFDMVRLGIGLYGIGCNEAETVQLQPASTLSTRISQVKTVPAGTSIGYGRAFRNDTEMRIAVLPIGYADGLSRILGNGKGKVFINGKRAPYVGNICMDMCMVDVSHLECQEGDCVQIFGADISISELAKDMGTIPYEVLTSISRRVKRVYVQE